MRRLSTPISRLYSTRCLSQNRVGIRVGDVEPSNLAEENVQFEFSRKLLVELQARVHEGNALGREVVGADDGRVASTRAAPR